jgi:Ca-activated chloride channel homolog
MKSRVFAGIVALFCILITVAWIGMGCSSAVQYRGVPAGTAQFESPDTPSGPVNTTRAPSTGAAGSIGTATTGGHPIPEGESQAHRLSSLLPPQSLPSPDEELWIISKPPQDRAAPRSDDPIPGQGQLMAKRDEAGGQKLVPVPLKHTDVKASVLGYIATVDVKQEYQNPFNDKIEAVYVFPLPQNAAVNEFVMTVGARRIRGIIRERHEAEQIYQQAKSQGYVASLLTQERPNVFTQAIANIEPGKRIDIDIKYFNTLSYADGNYELAFPMVVGPRFNPPGYSDGIGAVARGDVEPPDQKTQMQFLRPNERSGSDISLSVDIDAGVPIDNIESRNHKIAVKRVSATRSQVTLDHADNIPNRDFVLRYRVAGNAVKPALIAQGNGAGGYLTLMLFPPQLMKDLPRQPLEFVFTIDVSGSQSGRPLEQEKAATRYALTHLGPADTFQVVRFGNTAEKFFPEPQPATAGNVRDALQWVDGFEAGGGTMLMDGIHAALLFPHDPSRTRYVAFMTDGFIGNDAEAIAEVQKCLGPARLFSFGVGQATNRYLLDGMARMGRGAVAYLGLNDDANQVMDQYFQRISHPAMSDLAIDWNNAKVHDVFPAQVPDLYVGRPVILTGRYEGELPKWIALRATIGGREQRIEVPIEQTGALAQSNALASVWARMKISDVADRAACRGGIDLAAQVRQIAMEYNLLSAYTAFIAVDARTRTAGDHGISVEVPVPVPEGVRYDTTVEEAGSAQAGTKQ